MASFLLISVNGYCCMSIYKGIREFHEEDKNKKKKTKLEETPSTCLDHFHFENLFDFGL